MSLGPQHQRAGVSPGLHGGPRCPICARRRAQLSRASALGALVRRRTLRLTPRQRGWLLRQDTRHARVLLALAYGAAQADVARAEGVSRATVAAILRRWSESHG